MLRGASVPFKVTVRYALDIAPHGAVILVFQDESNKVVTGEREQTTVEVEKGNGTATLADEVVVPSDANELRLFIPIMPDGLATTTGEITLRYPITSSFSGPQYMPYPLADITAAQWEDYHRLVAETFAASRREFPDEHLEVFHSPDSALHLAFTTRRPPRPPGLDHAQGRGWLGRPDRLLRRPGGAFRGTVPLLSGPDEEDARRDPGRG